VEFLDVTQSLTPPKFGQVTPMAFAGSSRCPKNSTVSLEHALDNLIDAKTSRTSERLAAMLEVTAKRPDAKRAGLFR
jgi:hypothetical protein